MPLLTNPRWERFAQALFEGETADAAYMKAGYSENRGNASRLKANENILARVAELQAAAAKAAEITVESICAELDEANAIAKANGQASAMVSASTLRAKLAGLLTERVEVKTNNDAFDNAETMEDVAAALAEAYRDKGYVLTPEQRPEFARLIEGWINAIDEYVAGCCAKPVSNSETIERRRLGLAPRQIGKFF